MIHCFTFCYDNNQLEKQSFIFPNLLYRDYKEVNILVTYCSMPYLSVSRQVSLHDKDQNKDEIYHA